ncbi:MAG TPA: ABC transporter permease [Vicinamibacterales bacterium]|nr:ABC transporter permease [Vicinamibacterales bacterium]
MARSTLIHASRSLMRTPLYTATAVLSLAIGIGANVAIFTAGNALLVAPPAGIAEPDRVVDIGRSQGDGVFDTVSYPTFEAVRDTTDVFTGVYAVNLEPEAISIGSRDGAERVYAQLVTAGFFDVLGVTPERGAFFHASEERVGTPLRKVVLSEAFWRRRYAADPAMVGSSLTINGETFVVTGVAARGFRGTTFLAPDVWLPVTATATGLPTTELMTGRRNSWLVMGARLRPNVTLAQARQALDAAAARLAAEYPDAYQGRGLSAFPLSRVPGEIGSFTRIVLAVLMGLVGLVLVVACANLAGLMLARSASRSREIAVRLALGASRRSLVGMLLAESLLLFVVAAAASLMLARWTTALLANTLTTLPFPVALDMNLDWRVMLFTGTLALVASLLTGLAPALQSTRPAIVGDLKGDASAPRRRRLRRAFVAAQMAAGCVLITIAALFMHALSTASRVDTGMAVDSVDIASLDLNLASIPEARWPQAADEIRQRLAAVPGVTAAALGVVVPLEGSGMGRGAIRRRGDREGSIDADWNVISPEYLPVLGIPIVTGRGFTATDRAGSPGVAIVNERFARTAWPGENAIGQRLEVGDFRQGSNEPIDELTVVGIARDSKYRWVGEEPRNFIYVPYAQQAMSGVRVFVRRDAQLTSSDALAAPIRAALRDYNRNLPLVGYASLRSFADLGLLPQRLAASFGGALGLLALLLSAIGIYSVTAQLVASRTREIGVRMALGADPRRVSRLVLGEGLRVTIVGGAVGLLLAFGAGQLVSSLLFGVSPIDPLAFGGTAAALVVVAVAASLKPALRAARLDPVTALRAE